MSLSSQNSHQMFRTDDVDLNCVNQIFLTQELAHDTVLFLQFVPIADLCPFFDAHTLVSPLGCFRL